MGEGADAPAARGRDAVERDRRTADPDIRGQGRDRRARRRRVQFGEGVGRELAVHLRRDQAGQPAPVLQSHGLRVGAAVEHRGIETAQQHPRRPARGEVGGGARGDRQQPRRMPVGGAPAPDPQGVGPRVQLAARCGQ
ncbi:MAG: hypothetical protein ACLGG9_02400, partial [Thermoleophilia bacterium]